VAGGWRRLHIEELNYLSVSPDNGVVRSRRVIWTACSMHERGEKCVQNFGRKAGMEDTTRNIKA
jgi:hypothetical protein